MTTYLIAVTAKNELDVHQFLSASPLGPENPDSSIESWWVAEDNRRDGSDNDSAIFVPYGAQEDMVALLDQHFEHKKPEWDEDGYPYAKTDVSGAWYHEPVSEKDRAKMRFHRYLKAPCPEKGCSADTGELCDTPSVWLHVSRMKLFLKDKTTCVHCGDEIVQIQVKQRGTDRTVMLWASKDSKLAQCSGTTGEHSPNNT